MLTENVPQLLHLLEFQYYKIIVSSYSPYIRQSVCVSFPSHPPLLDTTHFHQRRQLTMSGGMKKSRLLGGASSATTPPLAPAGGPATATPGARNLQERLHILLSRLAKTTDLVREWPESEGDDSSIHAETTSRLIASILEVVSALQRVEGTIKADGDLKKALQECQVPINLLDLLDHGNGLNPGASPLAVMYMRRLSCMRLLLCENRCGWDSRPRGGQLGVRHSPPLVQCRIVPFGCSSLSSQSLHGGWRLLLVPAPMFVVVDRWVLVVVV
jgi:hypothetical protein